MNTKTYRASEREEEPPAFGRSNILRAPEQRLLFFTSLAHPENLPICTSAFFEVSFTSLRTLKETCTIDL